jgi:hypothetical protein
MAYTVRAISSRTKAITIKRKIRRVFFSVYLFKIGSIRCNVYSRANLKFIALVKREVGEEWEPSINAVLVGYRVVLDS